jgi:hypothetical protein
VLRIEKYLQKWITVKPDTQSPPALGLAAKTRTEKSEHVFTVLPFLICGDGAGDKKAIKMPPVGGIW